MRRERPDAGVRASAVLDPALRRAHVVSLLRSSRALPYLSVLSVGLAKAALTGAALGAIFRVGAAFNDIAALCAVPALAVGVSWAALLRWRRAVGPLVWLLSVPLAALEGGLSTALLACLKGSPGGRWLDALTGFMIGTLLWFPATIVVLALLGLPLAWAQRQARRGLDGAERGEALAGLVFASLSLVVLLALVISRQDVWVLDIGSSERNVLVSTPLLRGGQVGAITLAVLATLGLLAGGATTALAVSRGRRRRRLIEVAEAGEHPDYRVEHTDAGRVLVRVRPAAADDYRQADADEESFALEPEQAVSQPTDAPAARPGA